MDQRHGPRHHDAVKLAHGLPGTSRLLQVLFLCLGLFTGYDIWLGWRPLPQFWVVSVLKAAAFLYFGVLPFFFGTSKSAGKTL
jgi:hypothetical protein